MNVKVIQMSESAIQLQVEGADYSLSEIVHKELLSVKHVKFAGVAPPHPLIKVVTIQVHTDGTAEAKSLVAEAVRSAQGKINALLEATHQTFPGAVKVAPAALQQ